MLPLRTNRRPICRRGWHSTDTGGGRAGDPGRRHTSRTEPVGSVRVAVGISASISDHLRGALRLAGRAALRHLVRENHANGKLGTVGLHLSNRALRTMPGWQSARTGNVVTPGEFIVEWLALALKERSSAQEHCIDMCRLLGEPMAAESDPTGERHCFERGPQPPRTERMWPEPMTNGPDNRLGNPRPQ